MSTVWEEYRQPLLATLPKLSRIPYEQARLLNCFPLPAKENGRQVFLVGLFLDQPKDLLIQLKQLVHGEIGLLVADPYEIDQAITYCDRISRAEIANCKGNSDSCPKYWKCLKETSAPKVRICTQCHREVHWAETEHELCQLIESGHCVAYACPECELFDDLDASSPLDTIRNLTELDHLDMTPDIIEPEIIDEDDLAGKLLSPWSESKRTVSHPEKALSLIASAVDEWERVHRELPEDLTNLAPFINVWLSRRPLSCVTPVIGPTRLFLGRSPYSDPTCSPCVSISEADGVFTAWGDWRTPAFTGQAREVLDWVIGQIDLLEE